jgi:radical SAM superfamily enzyme YgiQ (UPF0313 family)
VREAKSAGLEVRAAFVLGTPGETQKTIRETLDYAISLDPNLAIFNITTPYPGTQLFDWAVTHDRLKTYDWWDYELGEPIVDLGTVSGEELKVAYDVAYKEFYNRPKIFLERARKIRSFAQLKDSVDAFLQMIWKVKLSDRGAYRKEWLRHRREDFFDLDFKLEKKPVKLPLVLQDPALLGA